jgi:hypothetical protein
MIELQKIDCNCNDCGYMVRDFDKLNSFNHLYGKDIRVSWRPQYGFCVLFRKDVSFIPGTCQPQTQDCFVHRKEFTILNTP